MTDRFTRAVQFWIISGTLLLTDGLTSLRTARAPQTHDGDDRHDRGDVPGWVMITVMTAIVVIALLAVFRTQVTEAVRNAFDSVNDQVDK